VLFGNDVYPLHPPGEGEARAATFPWLLALRELAAVAPGAVPAAGAAG
jgi:hypothetical protein